MSGDVQSVNGGLVDGASSGCGIGIEDEACVVVMLFEELAGVEGPDCAEEVFVGEFCYVWI